MPTGTTAARGAAVAWIAFIALLAVLPFGTVSAREPVVWVAIVPFDTIGHALARGLTAATFVSIVGNVAAFVPIGLLAPLGWDRWRSWPAAVALGVGVSLAIEASQLAISIAVGIPYRRADVDDVILNGLGTAFGYAAWLGLRVRGRRS
jgi:glycopeptide antibiotics resistance protein